MKLKVSTSSLEHNVSDTIYACSARDYLRGKGLDPAGYDIVPADIFFDYIKAKIHPHEMYAEKTILGIVQRQLERSGGIAFTDFAFVDTTQPETGMVTGYLLQGSILIPKQASD